RGAGRAEVTIGESTWIVDRARLLDVRHDGRLTAALPVAPPEAAADEAPLQRHHIDEALCLARFFDRRADAASVSCHGDWLFPVVASEEIPRLPRAA
ncbi:MAG: hypothetical protein ACR2O6_15485, partial [Ilumatobacteraceae bacterium]